MMLQSSRNPHGGAYPVLDVDFDESDEFEVAFCDHVRRAGIYSGSRLWEPSFDNSPARSAYRSSPPDRLERQAQARERARAREELEFLLLVAEAEMENRHFDERRRLQARAEALARMTVSVPSGESVYDYLTPGKMAAVKY